MTDVRQKLALQFAQNVQKHRKDKGLTQSDLAELVGLDQRYIQYIEHGKRVPSAPLAYLISKALEVPLHELFEWILFSLFYLLLSVSLNAVKFHIALETRGIFIYVMCLYFLRGGSPG